MDTKIVLNWLLASTRHQPATSQIGVNFKQTEHEEREGRGQAKVEEGDPKIMVN